MNRRAEFTRLDRVLLRASSAALLLLLVSTTKIILAKARREHEREVTRSTMEIFRKVQFWDLDEVRGRKVHCFPGSSRVGPATLMRYGYGEPISDLWGHPLVFRFPGPVHGAGWDLWSAGPNGIDEDGEGDDVLVGEDLIETAR